MMAIAILMAGLSGLVTGWLLTSAHAAKELRRKHAEWNARESDMRSDIDDLVRELRKPGEPAVYFIHSNRGKTGGDAA